MTDTIATSRDRRARSPSSNARAGCSARSAPSRSWSSGTRDARLAIEDRCPHLGFPLHQGTVEAGLLTCHWHHARFDLVSGCTLDPWADDAQGFDVELAGDDVIVHARAIGRSRRAAAAAAARRPRAGPHARDREGSARPSRSVGAAERDRAHRHRVRLHLPRPTVGAQASRRSSRWPTCSTGSPPTTRRSRSCTRSRSSAVTREGERRASRSRRCAPTRSTSTACPTGTGGSSRPARRMRRNVCSRLRSHAGASLTDVEAFMEAAVTDHVFIDEGHTLDFTNKAFEALGHVGPSEASIVLPTLVRQTAARAALGGVLRVAPSPRPRRARAASRGRAAAARSPRDVSISAGSTTSPASAGGCSPTIPTRSSSALLDAMRAGATPEQLGRALAYAAVAADLALPRAERLRRLEHRPPRVHRGERAAPGAGPQRRRPS